MPHERVLIISPVRNEATHVRGVVEAMAAQTRRPDEWIVVDDGSVDGTREILERAADELPFMRVVSAPPDQLPTGADRLAHAAAPRVFNHGLGLGSAFTYVGKLDGDIELPADYFERLLSRFSDDPQLGIAGGIVVEQRAGVWLVHGTSNLDHVRGALRLYSRECFEAVGGVREVLGWDGIDVALARMRGYRTQSFPSLSHATIARRGPHRDASGATCGGDGVSTSRDTPRTGLRRGRSRSRRPTAGLRDSPISPVTATPRSDGCRASTRTGIAPISEMSSAAARRRNCGGRGSLAGSDRGRSRSCIAPARVSGADSTSLADSPADVTVVIVSFNDWHWLEPCLTLGCRSRRQRQRRCRRRRQRVRRRPSRSCESRFPGSACSRARTAASVTPTTRA